MQRKTDLELIMRMMDEAEETYELSDYKVSTCDPGLGVREVPAGTTLTCDVGLLGFSMYFDVSDKLIGVDAPEWY